MSPARVVKALHDPDRHLVDGVVPVAEAVPLGLLWLGPAGQVGGSGANRRRTGALHAADQLPPLPAVAVAIADEAGVLPRAPADAHLDARDRSRPRPRDPPDCDVSGRQLLAGSRLGDQAPHTLQGDRFPHNAPVALPLEEV